MKFKNLIMATFLSSAIFIGITEAKQLPEYYSLKIVEAEEKANFLLAIDLLNKMVKEYDGDIWGIKGKLHLFNLYQGKCRRDFSGTFLEHIPSQKCNLMVNLPKATDLLEELVEDSEAFVRRNSSHRELELVYNILVYTANNLEVAYRNGFPEANVKPNQAKSNKYLRIKAKYEALLRR